MVMRNFKKIRVLGGLLFILINAGVAEENKDTQKQWTGDISLGLTLARGNTETSNLSFSFSAKRILNSKLDWNNSGFFLFGKIKSTTNAESLGISSSINWKHSHRFFSYYKIQVLRDRFKNYDYRLLPAVGVGYKLVSSEKTEFSLNAGLSEVFTKYQDTGETEAYSGLALGDNLIWKISPTADLTQQFTLTADLTEFPHFFARLEINMTAAINNNWALKLSLIDGFENQPVGEGIKKNDVTFLAGLSLKF